ncbi:alcohol dehydrogenase catalytic domain-containing protein [Nocardia sp. NPDC006630]|uniref:alcohol dehydrogenase catalytic domain-containing protein n=1 Tax=Nocardia sp. NPDC006630 TaxID=3157181 RepID=UPI0033AD41BB
MSAATSVEHRALIREGHTLRIQRDLTTPGLGASVFRILRAGVCGTDLQILRGARRDQATILGHEAIAVREATEHGARGCVIFNPVYRANQDQILGHSYPGVWQDPLITSNPCHSVPAQQTLPVDLGPLVEPIATALYAWELMSVHLPARSRVAVIGGGSAAMLVAIVGEQLGYRMLLVHPRRERLAYLTRLCLLASTDLSTQLAPGSVDGALVCAPREAAIPVLAQAVSAVTDGGVVDLFGGIADDLRHPALPGARLGAVRRRNICGHNALKPAVQQTLSDQGKKLWITGHRGTSDEQLEQAQLHLLHDPERFAAMITSVISLEAAAQQIPMMAQQIHTGGEHLKVLVDPTMTTYSRPVDLTVTVADLLAQEHS